MASFIKSECRCRTAHGGLCMTVAPRGCGLGLASQTGNPQGGPRVAPRKDTCLPTSSAAASSRRRETKLFPPVVGRPVISSNQGGQLRSRPSRLAGHVTAGVSGPTGLGADRSAQLPLERARGARAGRTTVGGARGFHQRYSATPISTGSELSARGSVAAELGAFALTYW